MKRLLITLCLVLASFSIVAKENDIDPNKKKISEKIQDLVDDYLNGNFALLGKYTQPGIYNREWTVYHADNENECAAAAVASDSDEIKEGYKIKAQLTAQQDGEFEIDVSFIDLNGNEVGFISDLSSGSVYFLNEGTVVLPFRDCNNVISNLISINGKDVELCPIKVLTISQIKSEGMLDSACIEKYRTLHYVPYDDIQEYGKAGPACRRDTAIAWKISTLPDIFNPGLYNQKASRDSLCPPEDGQGTAGFGAP
ncbi:MAG: hypothetical protein Tsb002_05500 [Wenzhouxiangellaceae bacterium]